jgi:hypothetical protein
VLIRQQTATMLVNVMEQTSGMSLISGYSPFTDIAGSVHEENIEKGYLHEVIAGYPDKTFRPTQNVTREQFVTLLVNVTERLAFRPLSDASNVFTDDDGSVHETNIDKAAKAGILEGIPVQGTTFHTGAPVTRGEAAQMISNAVTKVLVAEGRFPQ